MEKNEIKLLAREISKKHLTDEKMKEVFIKLASQPSKMYLFTVTADLGFLDDEFWKKCYDSCKKRYPLDARKHFKFLGDLDEFILLPSNNMTLNYYMIFKDSKTVKFCITSSIPVAADILHGKEKSKRFNSINETIRTEIRGELCGWDQELMSTFNKSISNYKPEKVVGSITFEPWYWFGMEKKYQGIFYEEADMLELKDNIEETFDPYHYILALCNEMDNSQFLSSNGILADMKSILDNKVTRLANETGLSPKEVLTKYRLDILKESTTNMLEILSINVDHVLRFYKGDRLAYVLDGVLDAVRRCYIRSCVENDIPMIVDTLTPKYNKLLPKMFQKAKECVYEHLIRDKYDTNKLIHLSIANNMLRNEEEKEMIERMKAETHSLISELMNRFQDFDDDDDDDEDKQLIN